MEGALAKENNVLATYEETSTNGTFVGWSPAITLTKQNSATSSQAASSRHSSLLQPGYEADGVPASTSSSYAWLPITVPSDAQYLSLDITMHNLSPNDFVSIGVNDTPLFQLEYQFTTDGVTANTGFLDISQWQGQSVQLFLGLSAADDLNQGGTIVVDDMTIASMPEPCATSMALIFLSFGLLRRPLKRKSEFILDTRVFVCNLEHQ